MVMELRASLGADGRVSAWSHETYSDTYGMRPRPGPDKIGPARLLATRHLAAPLAAPEPHPAMARHVGIHRNLDPIYTFADRRLVKHLVRDLPLRTSALRALGAYANVFAIESFIDELAHRAGQDPIDYRLAMLDAAGKNAGDQHGAVGGAARQAAVLKDVRERSGWGRELPEGEGLGVACCFGQQRDMATWIGCVAHVAVDKDSKSVKVIKIWQSIDCGTVVHPDGAMAQAEGATLWGVSLAVHEGTTFKDGQVVDRNLDTYTPLRMADVPELDIKFMQSTEFPTGLGEPPVIPVAPAIGNAIYAASGIRARDLPIKL
jgi:CO/xanthine dehydrogenase Mo-binding subunit